MGVLTSRIVFAMWFSLGHSCILHAVLWGFDKKTVAVLKEMQGALNRELSRENSDSAAADKVQRLTTFTEFFIPLRLYISRIESETESSTQ